MTRRYSFRRLLLWLLGVLILLLIIATASLLHQEYILLPIDRFRHSHPYQHNSSQDIPQLLLQPAGLIAPNTQSGSTISNSDVIKLDSSYSLSPKDCHDQFPDLYVEIDRAVQARNRIGNITSADVDISWKTNGFVRALIHNQKLYVIEAKFNGQGYDRPRLLASLHQINRAITTSPIAIPDIEFSFVVTDRPDELHANHTTWAFSRHVSLDPNIWLMPDFGYWSWPLDLVGEYRDIRADMRAKEVRWDYKVPKLFWRGAINTNKEVRGALLQATSGKNWADVQEVTWKSRTKASDGSAPLPIAEHCRYQFLVHTEGRSYSGRGKYLLNCASITITHQPEWIESHTHLFTPSGPNQNVVEIRRDFTDLEDKMTKLLQDSEHAKAIVSNSVTTFRNRYLTPAAETCYWRQLMLSWAGVSFILDPWKIDQDGKKKMRGIPFESFVAETVDVCTWWKKLTLRC